MDKNGVAAVGGGGVRVGIGHEDDSGDGIFQCIDHPYKSNTNPGGICAFCLQEKLGKLVSSSSFPIRGGGPSSSSSTTSPSFRSDVGGGGCGGSSSSVKNESCQYFNNQRGKSRVPYFLLKKKKTTVGNSSLTCSTEKPTAEIVFKRSKSTTTTTHLFDDFTPRKSFWSFLLYSKKATSASSSSSTVNNKQKEKCLLESSSSSLTEEEPVPAPVAFDRKVSRSRSVGCGSRSFSGDFFERISTGFGDCTLRRVESQREGKSKSTMKERVKCGGIFGGFIMNSTEEQRRLVLAMGEI